VLKMPAAAGLKEKLRAANVLLLSLIRMNDRGNSDRESEEGGWWVRLG
jgi:hypothetical protein